MEALAFSSLNIAHLIHVVRALSRLGVAKLCVDASFPVP
jgi:hypothetical protein